MIRPAAILLLAAGLTLAAAPSFAQTADAPHRARKAGKPKRAVAAPSAPSAPPHSINAPSTDFSKIERSDDGSGGPDGPSFHPTMGAGGMGLGGSF